MNDEELLEKITLNPKIMAGKPVIYGTRLTVEFVLNLLAHGASVEEILSEYKDLTREDIQACLLFASADIKLDKDLLWKQYGLHVDLYKHYLDLVLKFNIFYYASTGAILSFYFSKPDLNLIKYSLLFPVFASFCFGFLFLYGATQLKVTREKMFDIRDKLDLDTAPEFHVLSVLLLVSALLMFGVAIVILVLFFSR